MTHAADNQQQPGPPISEVGARAWGLATSAARPAAWAEGLAARRQLGIGAGLIGASPAARYVMRWLAFQPSQMALLRRLPEHDAAPQLDMGAWLRRAERSDGVAAPAQGRIRPEAAASAPPATGGQPASALPAVQRAGASHAAAALPQATLSQPAPQPLVTPVSPAMPRVAPEPPAAAVHGAEAAAPVPGLPRVAPAPSAAAAQPTEAPALPFVAPMAPVAAARRAEAELSPRVPPAPLPGGTPWAVPPSPVLAASAPAAPLPLLMRSPASPEASAALARVSAEGSPALLTARPAPLAPPSTSRPQRAPANPTVRSGEAVAPLQASRLAAPGTPTATAIPGAPLMSAGASQSGADAAPTLPFLAPLVRRATFAADLAANTAGPAPSAPLPLVMRAPAERPAASAQPEAVSAIARPALAREAEGTAAHPRAAVPSPNSAAQPYVEQRGATPTELPRVAPASLRPTAQPSADVGPSLPFLTPILQRAAFAPAYAPNDSGARGTPEAGRMAERAADHSQLPVADTSSTAGAPAAPHALRASSQLMRQTMLPMLTPGSVFTHGDTQTSEHASAARSSLPRSAPGAVGVAAEKTAATIARRLAPVADPPEAPKHSALSPLSSAPLGNPAAYLGSLTPNQMAGPRSGAQGNGSAGQRLTLPGAIGVTAETTAARIARRLAPAQPGETAWPTDMNALTGDSDALHRLPSTVYRQEQAFQRAAQAPVPVRPAPGASPLPLLQRALVPASADASSPEQSPAPSLWSAPASLGAAPGVARAPAQGGWPAPGSLTGRHDASTAPGAAPALGLLRPSAPLQRAPDAAAQPTNAPGAPGAASELNPSSATQSAAQPAAEPDIDAIAQKVYEQLRRRLRVDQERLGRY